MNDNNKKQVASESKIKDIKFGLDSKISELRAKIDKGLQSVLPKTYKEMLLPRNPVPPLMLDDVSPLCFEGATVRYVGDKRPKLNFSKVANVLTLSGGGANGAYGAGLLSGWTRRGSRPEFDVVMGVSTGAIIGLFAFLGMRYDDTLRKLYNEYNSEDLVSRQVFQGLTVGVSMYDNTKFIDLLTCYIDKEVLYQLAEAHRAGRVLLVGTTNLDRSRPVTWDLTAIASTKDIHATRLIRNIVLASCSIPVVFSPVMLPVFDCEGNEFDEMHADGGAARQILVDMPLSQSNVYIIINNRLSQPYYPVELSALDIANKALRSLISGSAKSDLYQIYNCTLKNNSSYNATWIDDVFCMDKKEMFDAVYMRNLYEFGYQSGLSGYAWHEKPPE